jgi:hypothetical protein
MVKTLLLVFTVVIFGLSVDTAVAAPKKPQYRVAGSIEAGMDATDKQIQAWNHFVKLQDVGTGEEFYAFTFQVEKPGRYQVNFVAGDAIIEAKAEPMDVQYFRFAHKHTYGVVVSEQLINKLKSSYAPAAIFGKEKGLPSDMTRLAF